MANPNQKDNLISNIEELLEEFGELEKSDITRREELGKEYSFEEASELIEILFEQIDILKRLDLGGLTGESLNEILEALNGIDKTINNISSFDPSRNNRADRTQNKYLDDFDSHLQNLRKAVAPALAHSDIRTESMDKMAQELEQKLERAEEVETEMKSILESVREASAAAGVSTHANIFGDEATGHQKKSWVWMGAFIVMGGMTAIVAAWFTFRSPIPPDATIPQLVQFVSGKLIILSILYYGIIWCSRNYFAHRHNFVVNTQRQNALSTFETFANATDDEGTKDTILVEAAEAIFSVRDSGYNKGRDGEDSGKVREIIRTLRGGSGVE